MKKPDYALLAVMVFIGAWGGFFLGRSYERRIWEPQLRRAIDLAKQWEQSPALVQKWRESYERLEAECRK